MNGMQLLGLKSVQAPRDCLSGGQTSAAPTEAAQARPVSQAAVASCGHPFRVASCVIRRTAEAWSI